MNKEEFIDKVHIVEEMTDDKPLQDILELIKVVTPHTDFRTVSAQTDISLTQGDINYCAIIIEGVVSVIRDADRLTLGMVYSPFIIGSSFLNGHRNIFSIKTESCSRLGLINLMNFSEIITTYKLWRQVASVQSYIIQRFLMLSAISVAKTAYEVIKSHLYMLSIEPEIVRHETFVASYILKRTKLSRSTVMKILFQLKKGNYIEIQNGHLVKINDLPYAY
ncbi:hypothetical protein AV553_25455 [Salmonella enterica]|nr:hypothetical protein [Salmonella enterica]ECV7800671.1 hypothetical protein [Salmonella enterica subsp. enterica serovar Brandenburg]EIO7472033.1 helix-turn-helix domain-containing protein [Salmonella enterica subsp. enterica]EIY5768827.1 helix-turn-helix domain-containing protein [Salmonella enterica subsp. enterica]